MKGVFMIQAIVTPEELRKYSSRLKQFNNSLNQMTTGLKGELEQLGETWRDREYDKFKQQFDETIRVISKFMEVSDEYAGFLIRKAEAAEDYLNRK